MIETLINADTAECMAAMEVDYRESMRRQRKGFAGKFWRALLRIEQRKYPLLAGVCRMVGHKLTDEGYGGPDSGCMDIRCTRCGWSQYIRLY